MSDTIDEVDSIIENEKDRMPEEDDMVQEEEKADEEMSFDLKFKKNVPPIRTASEVWNHFEKIFDDHGKHLHSRCNYCNQKYSAKCSTTTLGDHWRAKHEKIQPGGAGSIEMAFSNSQQVKLKGEIYLDSLGKLINWIIVECQPFRVVDSPSFKEFVHSLNSGFHVPSRQTVRNKIDEKYISYKSNIIKMFEVKLHLKNDYINYLIVIYLLISFFIYI